MEEDEALANQAGGHTSVRTNVVGRVRLAAVPPGGCGMVRSMSGSYDDFLARLRDRGGYADLAHAEEVLTAALAVLATRLSPHTAQALVDQLPAFLTEDLESRTEEEAEPFSAEEFCRRMAELNETDFKRARWDAAAVLTCLADTQPRGLTTQILHELPHDYAPLIGTHGLA